MSFANYDLESQKEVGIRNAPAKVDEGQQEGSNMLDEIIDKTSKQLQVFGSMIAKFSSQIRHVGTRRDSKHIRYDIDQISNQIDDLEAAISTLVTHLSSLINRESQQKSSGSNSFEVSNKQVVLKGRLSGEFNGLKRSFQKSKKIYEDKKSSNILKDDISGEPEFNERTPLIEGQHAINNGQEQIMEQDEDRIDATELRYHTMMTEERHQEIERVREGIEEVNAIFKDLGELVTRQGESLDTIEDNVLQLSGNTQQADQNLRKAHEYQKKKGKWTCILLIALCIFVLVVVLAVLS